MADKKISQLNITTTADDGSWLVMNDSGNTATYRITRADLLSGTTEPQVFKAGDAADSIVPSYFPSSAATSTNTTYLDKVELQGGVLEIGIGDVPNTITPPVTNGYIVIGQNNTVNTYKRPMIVLGDSNLLSTANGGPGNNGSIVIGAGNNLNNAYAFTNLVMGGYNTLTQQMNFRLGNNGNVAGSTNISVGEQNTTGGNGCISVGAFHNLTGSYQTVTGYDNDITAGNNHSIVGGTLNDITSTGSNGFIAGGTGNLIGGGNHNFIGGASNAQSNGGSNNAILGGTGTLNNTSVFSLIGSSPSGSIQGGNDQNNAMISSLQSSMGFNGAYGSVMLGGYYNYFKNFYGTNNEYRWSTSVLLGGYNNKQAADDGASNGAVAMGVMLGGMNNQTKATNATRFPTFISTESSVIQGGASRAVVIGGTSNTIDGKTDAIMIGTSGRTALYDKTIHTENTHTYKTESFGVVSGGNVGGNIDVDCSLGTIYTFTMTANTTPNFINFRDGQRITFVITNTTFAVPSATIDGGGSVYAKNGSIAPSNNNKTLYYGTFISGDLYIDEHTGFDAV